MYDPPIEDPQHTMGEILTQRDKRISELETKIKLLRAGLSLIIDVSRDLYATDTLARIAKQTLGSER
jgi:hypothetical protein